MREVYYLTCGDFSEHNNIAMHIILVLKGLQLYILEGNQLNSLKKDIMKVSSSLPSEIFCMKPVFGA